MKRVLQVLPCLELGGTEAFVMNHYREVKRDACQFDFMVFIEKEYPYLEEILRLGGKVFFSGAPSVGNLLPFMKNTRRILNENGPYDAIHCHAGISSSWALLVARQCGIPVRVAHSHGTDHLVGTGWRQKYHNLQAGLIGRCATKKLACGREAGVDLYGADVFDREGELVHNSIALEWFLATSEAETAVLRKEFDIPEACGLIVGNISRFDSNKNQLFALEVFAVLLKNRPDAICLLGGPDVGMLETVRKKAGELGIEQKVRFIGPRRDIPHCLKLMDVYLFPSFFEGVPIGLLEAQAAGCFCVVSDSVSVEADMGAGNLLFLPLAEGAACWAEQIAGDERIQRRPVESAIQRAFEARGYALQKTAGRLLEIYSGN